MKSSTLILLLVCAATFAIAEGDKNWKAGPVLSSDDSHCVYTLPEGIDISDCVEARAQSPDQSGQTIFFCYALRSDDGLLCFVRTNNE